MSNTNKYGNTMKKHLLALLISTAFTVPVFADSHNCKITEETDTYISKQCGENSFSTQSKFTIDENLTVIKDTGAVKTQVKKIIEDAKTASKLDIKIDNMQLLPMDQMLRILLDKNDRVRAATETYEASLHSLKSAYSAYYPNVSITVGRNGEKDRTVTGSAGVDTIANDSKDGDKKSITITQMIWDFGRTSIAVDIAKQTAQQSQIQLEITIEDVMIEALTSYISLRKSYTSLENQREVELNAKKALGMVIAKVKKGEAPKMEQLQIEQQYRTHQTMTVQNEIALDGAKQKFVNVWGVIPPKKDQLKLPPEDLLGTVPDKPTSFNGNKSLRAADYDKIIARLQQKLSKKDQLKLPPEDLLGTVPDKPTSFNGNKSLRAADYDKIISRLQQKLSKKEFAPTIDSSFSATDYDGTLGGGYGANKLEYRADITLRWTLFNGFKNTEDYKAATRRATAAEYTYIDTYKKLQEQVNTIFFNYSKLKSNIATLERTLLINSELYTLTLTDYKAGKSPLMAVFGMKTAEIMAKTALENAKMDLLVQRYTLNKMIGSIHNPSAK